MPLRDTDPVNHKICTTELLTPTHPTGCEHVPKHARCFPEPENYRSEMVKK